MASTYLEAWGHETTTKYVGLVASGRKSTLKYVGLGWSERLTGAGFWCLPGVRPTSGQKKASRIPFLIFETRFPGGLPEVDFRAFSVSSRLGAYEYATIRGSGRLRAQKHDKRRMSGRLGRLKYCKLRMSGGLGIRNYNKIR